MQTKPHERARVLLINPTITSRRHARFPLAVLSLGAALEGQYSPEHSSTATSTATSSHTALRSIEDGTIGAVGVTVMGGPQLLSAIAVSQRDPRAPAGAADRLGRRLSDRLSRMPP